MLGRVWIHSHISSNVCNLLFFTTQTGKMLKIILGLLEPFFQFEGISSPHLITIHPTTIQSYYGTQQMLVMGTATPLSFDKNLDTWQPAPIYECYMQSIHPPISSKTRDQEPPIVLTDHP